MLYSARVLAVLVFALISSAMAAPATKSLDSRVEALKAKVDEMALAAKSVKAKKVSAKVRGREGGYFALRASKVWCARFLSEHVWLA